MILNILYLLVSLVVSYYCLIRYQQNQYIIKRYVKSILRERRFLIVLFLVLVVNFIPIFFVKISLLILCLVYNILIVRPSAYKKKFKFTKRMVRFSIVLCLLSLSVLLIPYLIIVVPLFIIVTHLLLLPIEVTLKKGYMNAAKNKLNASGAKVVGITGSYGKTSAKNILYDMLKDHKYTLKTPESYNTPGGVSMTINNSLDALHEVFISEMGAYVIGEIEEICLISQPDIAIITSIGQAHLESFGSQENITQTKFEIVENLKEDGLAILNTDDELMMSYHFEKNCRVMTFGFNEDADVYASNLSYDINGSTFDINYVVDENHIKTYRVKTRLLGKHNIANILCAFCVCIELGIDLDKVVNSISYISPISHRLELKKFSNYTILDDAFNSNPTGAKTAVEMLGLMDGYKVVITPGMIELGEREDELNYEFGLQIANVSDFAIVVGAKQTRHLQKAFLEVGFENYYVAKSFDDGFSYFQGLSELNKILLIENDLPDIYNE